MVEASLVIAPFFLSRVLAFNSARRFVKPSSSVCNAFTLPVASALIAAVNLLASISLLPRNIRAMDAAVLAEVPAASQDFTADRVSSIDSSEPEKGVSASCALLTPSFTASSFCRASVSIDWKDNRSAASFCSSFSLVRRVSPAVSRSSNLASSLSSTGLAPVFFCCKKRPTTATCSKAFLEVTSACSSCSSLAPGPAALAACSALAMSCSAGVILASTSATVL
mmetsp:Transcript_48327/g.78518  ORF Transcript_48327/g.78518 Transcript_48327/m.78518 type:complete len:224 (-) Transcript_48327:579-1250(-)